MTTLTFDTLAYARKFEEAGFTRQQAEAQADAMRQQAEVQVSALREAIEKEEKILAGSGRVLVRPSGTELLIRVMVEAKEKAIADAAAEELSNLIKNKG